MPVNRLAIQTLIRGIFIAEGLTSEEADFAIRVAEGESNLGQNIDPHPDPSATGAQGTSQGIFQLRTPGLLDTFTRQGFTDWRNPLQEITFVARYVKANRNDGKNGWGPWSVAQNLIAGGDNPIPNGPGGEARANLSPLFGLSTEEVLALLASDNPSLDIFSPETRDRILADPAASAAFDALFPTAGGGFEGFGGTGLLTQDEILDQQIRDWLEIQYQLSLQQAFIDAGLDDAARGAGFAAEAAQRAFNNQMILLAEQNNMSVEAATAAFDRQLEVLGIQQTFQTDERVAAQEFSAEEAAKDRSLNERLNRLNAETSLANTIAQLQESARQQATTLLGVDPQRGAVAARGAQALGTSPAQKFQQSLRQFATAELPDPSTSQSTIGDIEGNISSLQDLAIGRPQPSPQLGAAPPGAAHGAQKDAHSLRRNTGGTAILVGEGPQGEGLLNNTAEVAIFREDGSAEIVPLSGRAQGGFTFTPGVKPRTTLTSAPVAAKQPTDGLGEAPGLEVPTPITGPEFQTVIDNLTPEDFGPGPSTVLPPALPPGQIDPQVADFIADLTVNQNPTPVDALLAEQAGLPDVARLINQFAAGLITREELQAGIPSNLLPASENEFLTEAQALLPIFQNLGLDFVPVGGRQPSGALSAAAGEVRAGLPRPLGAEAGDLFETLGTTPRLIREQETGQYFFRNSAGELSLIGDESDLATQGFNPRDAIELPSAQLPGGTGFRTLDVQNQLEPGEAFQDPGVPFQRGPIFSPLDEDQNIGIFLPNEGQLASIWPSLSDVEKRVIASAYSLAGIEMPDLLRSISFHTPGGLARGSVGSPRRSGVLA